MAWTLEGLPVEIQAHLLSSISDFESLLNLIISSRYLHEVYVRNRQIVIRDVLNNFIDPVVQADISRLTNLRRIISMTKNLEGYQLENFMESSKEGLQHSKLVDFEWAQLKRSQRVIDKLTDDLFQNNLNFAHAEGWTKNAGSSSLRQEERIRIQRALYRIDTWYYVAHENPSYFTQQFTQLFMRLPAWELDELGCVYDCLCRRLAAIIEQLTEKQLFGEGDFYELLFSEDTVPSRGTSHWVEEYFFHGLDKVDAIIQASKSTEEHSKYARIKYLGEGCRFRIQWWRGNELSAALREKHEGNEKYSTLAAGAAAGSLGPNKAWLWAHRDGDGFDWYQTHKADLGEWCANIWDDERLDEWGRLQDKWSKEHFQVWAPLRREQHVQERRLRISREPNKPKPMPCRHGLNADELPQSKGLLFYRGRTSKNDHEFSSCPLCFEEIEAKARVMKRPQVKVLRYGGERSRYP